MVRTIIVAVSLLLAIGPAVASEIPQSILDADYTQCHEACSPAQGEAPCTAYCICITDNMRTEFTLEEYTPMSSAIATGQEADAKSAAKFGGIVTICMRNTFQ